jgi:hypothetical protein
MTMLDQAGDAARGPVPGRYPVNLRLTVPFYPRPLFITLIVGWERRGRDRLREERERHPLNTWGNFTAAVSTWTVFITAALFAAFIAATL